MRHVRIGNGCGFWGDNIDAPLPLARDGRLDYLTLEYLAELTMSILAIQRQRDPEAGYAADFLGVLERLAPTLRDQPRLMIVTNAGGMNPLAEVTSFDPMAGCGGHAVRRGRTDGVGRSGGFECGSRARWPARYG